MVMLHRLMPILAVAGCFVLADCTKVAAPPPPQHPTPIVASNKNEPVIFNGQKFIVSFDYKGQDGAYDVMVRRASKPLREKEDDLKDAEQVAQSTLTHYACPGSSRARRLNHQSSLDKKGEWRSQFRCG
ncbi:hypothetical protein [Rhodoligotrophos ferricapiens]|uniref:hypothetical protein n=1 Tax=Rhodoligotrophos ferricapiens TaxID=3069264 RepID=UPI00315D4A4A